MICAVYLLWFVLNNLTVDERDERMNYKEMVLLEDLLEHFSSEHGYKILFTIEERFLCTGEFRKKETKENLSENNYPVIYSEKLLKEYKSFINDNDQNTQYVIDLFAHLQSNVGHKEEKLENYLLGSMTIFIMDRELNLNDCLAGYDGPETIYNFATQNGQHGEFDLNGLEVEPDSLYVLEETEKQ